MENHHKLGSSEIEFSNKLGVTRDLKKAFNKDYNVLVGNLDKLTMDDMIKFIYTCKVDKEDNLKDFTDWVYDESGAGVVNIMELLQELVLQIQYPNVTPDERKKLIMEKMKEERELTSS